MNYAEIAHMAPFPVNGKQEIEWQKNHGMRWTRELADCVSAHTFAMIQQRDRTEIVCGFEESDTAFRFDTIAEMNAFCSEKLAQGWWPTFRKYPTPGIGQDCIHWMNPESRSSSRFAGLTFG